MRSALRSSVWSSPASLEAVPSTPRPTGTPAASMSGTRAIPAARRALGDGQWAKPVFVRAKRARAAARLRPGERGDVGVVHVDAVRHPHVLAEPAGRLEVLGRAHAEQFLA